MAGLTASGRTDCYNGSNGGLRGNTRYLSLYVGDPQVSGVEITATGYSRLTRTTGQMPVTSGQIRIAMGEWDDSADASWGTPDYVGVHDAASGGNLKWSVPISPSITEIVAGSRVFTEADDITFQIPLS